MRAGVRSRGTGRGNSAKSSAAILAAAAASVGLATFAASPVSAGLMIELRAVSSTNPADIITPKAVTAHYGSDITFEIIAHLTGSDGVQQVGDFDGAPPDTDTRNNEALQIVVGSFHSVGALLGDFVPSNRGSNPHTSPFNALGSQNGMQSDWDSDGDLDIGNSGTDVSSMFAARAGARQYATVSHQTDAPMTRLGYSDDSGSFQQDFGGAHGAPPATSIIDANTSEMLLGAMDFVVQSTTGSTDLVFVPRPVNDGSAALWWEDGVATNVQPNGTNYTAGAPIVVSIPEPASAALLGIASLGLLARRKK